MFFYTENMEAAGVCLDMYIAMHYIIIYWISYKPNAASRCDFYGQYNYKSKNVRKQAKNGLQSRSSENGKTAVWHYGLKLQWYLTGDRD